MPSVRTRFRSRTATALTLAAMLTLGATGCALTAEPEPPPPSDGTPMDKLDQLTVANWRSMKGYSRDHFPHWRDTGRNCDVRDSVLQRDGKNIKLSGCNVVAGRWFSPYDNVSLTDPSEVDIDHVVPLANAWRSGANEWDDDRRGDFANDQTRPQLIAVSRRSNRAKGDQDPSRWKPPNREYWCTYAENWVTVKHYWRLLVTQEEKAALAEMMEGCTWASKS